MRKHSNTKPSIVAALCAALIAALLSPLPVNASTFLSGNLRDVPTDAWYADQVAALDAEYDLFHFTTCAEGFCGNEPLKRNVMAVWTVRILDNEEPGSATETRFNDVPTETTQDQYYAGFINRLYELGVTTGCGDRSGFCPEDPVTRAQMAAFLTRAFELPEGPAHGFDDIPADAWYSDDVSALKASGITTGCDDNTGFCPQEPTTRAQMAVFLHRALNPVDPATATTTTSTTTTSVPAAADRVAPPLQRCSQPGERGHGRLSVLIGFPAADPVYEAVARGEDNSCELIMEWWDDITKLEAERSNRGDYPCEYPMRYNFYDAVAPDLSWNGPPLLVQCWPRMTARKFQVSDPDLHAAVADIMDYKAAPPATRPMLEALWYCYRSYVQGADPGKPGTYATTPNWCNEKLPYVGPAVRFAGVTPECAARMYIGQVNELINDEGNNGGNSLPVDSNNQYAGDYSWGNCSTTASRLIPADLADAPFRQRCEVMLDAAADERTDAVAARGGGTRADVIAVVKAMYCGGTREGVRQHAPKLQKYLPENWKRDYWRASEVIWGDDISTDRSFGYLARYWAGVQGTPCFEAAMLVNARHAVLEGNPFSKVKYC